MKNIQINKIVKEISKNKDILAVYLFGSFRDKTNGSRSDVDICVIGKLNDNEKKKILRESPEVLDISFFDELPIFIKVRVFRFGKELYLKNQKEIDLIKLNTLKEYRDFMLFVGKRVKEVFENVR